MTNRLLLSAVTFGVSVGLSLMSARNLGKAIGTGLVAMPSAFVASLVVEWRQNHRASRTLHHLKQQIRVLYEQRLQLQQSLMAIAAERQAVAANLYSLQNQFRQAQLQPAEHRYLPPQVSWNLAASSPQREREAIVRERETRQEFETRSQALQETIQTLERRELELTRAFSATEVRLKALQTEFNQLQVQVVERQTQKANLEQSLADLSQQKVQLEQTTENLRQHIQQLEQSRDDLSQTVSFLTAEKQKFDKAPTPLQAAQEQLQAQVISLRAELEGLEAQILERRQQKAELEQELAHFNQLVHQLEATQLHPILSELEHQWTALPNAFGSTNGSHSEPAAVPQEPEPSSAKAQPSDRGLPPEWTEFMVQLSDPELQALKAIAQKKNPSTALRQIAETHLTMPELLINAINERALETVGDLILEPITRSGGVAIATEHIVAVKQLLEVYDYLTRK